MRSAISTHSHGFTLLELMVVMVLIGITAALILPEMRGTMDDMALRSTARELVSACALASSQAITVSKVHRVAFDSETRQYRLERAGARESGETAFVPVDHVPGAKGQLDRRITIRFGKAEDEAGPDESERLPHETDSKAAGRDTLSFYPDGTADPGEVLLSDRQGFTMSLRINPTTGRVRVTEPEPK